MERLKRLRAELEARNYEAFLATQKPNQLYFIDHPDPSGIFRSLPYMLITLKESIVFPGVWISNACGDFLAHEEVVINEVGGPDVTDQLIARLKKLGLKRIAIDGAIQDRIRTEVSKTEFVVESRLGAELRRQKEPQELELMRRVAAISDAGMKAAFEAIRPGILNCEVAAEGVYKMLKMGCEDASMFVASGPDTMYLDSGSDPRRMIQQGDMVFIDMGIHLQGYLGDQTRSAILGGGTRQQRELLSTIKASYLELEAALKPGARAQDIYVIAVRNVERKGWRKFFVHHISHGLGLGGDLPNINSTSNDALQVGDTLSCEPGVYVPGIGGARIENMILITENGAEPLTKLPIDMVLSV